MTSSLLCMLQKHQIKSRCVIRGTIPFMRILKRKLEPQKYTNVHWRSREAWCAGNYQTGSSILWWVLNDASWRDHPEEVTGRGSCRASQTGWQSGELCLPSGNRMDDLHHCFYCCWECTPVKYKGDPVSLIFDSCLRTASRRGTPALYLCLYVLYYIFVLCFLLHHNMTNTNFKSWRF